MKTLFAFGSFSKYMRNMSDQEFSEYKAFLPTVPETLVDDVINKLTHKCEVHEPIVEINDVDGALPALRELIKGVVAMSILDTRRGNTDDSTASAAPQKVFSWPEDDNEPLTPDDLKRFPGAVMKTVEELALSPIGKVMLAVIPPDIKASAEFISVEKIGLEAIAVQGKIVDMRVFPNIKTKIVRRHLRALELLTQD